MSYAKGVALGALVFAAACGKDDGHNVTKSEPTKAKTVKIVQDLRAQNDAATEFTKEVHGAKGAISRSTGDIIQNRVTMQDNLINEGYVVFQNSLGKLISGDMTITGFETGAQNYANTAGLDMGNTLQKIIAYHEFSAKVAADAVPSIPLASLGTQQRSNLTTFKNAAYNLLHAVDVLGQLTEGILEAEEQVAILETQINNLSGQLVTLLETITGKSIPVGDKQSTAAILQTVESVISGMTEAQLAPYSSDINRIATEIEQVQSGIDTALSKWQDLEETTRNDALAVSTVKKPLGFEMSHTQQKQLAKNFATKSAFPGKVVQRNAQRVRMA